MGTSLVQLHVAVVLTYLIYPAVFLHAFVYQKVHTGNCVTYRPASPVDLAPVRIATKLSVSASQLKCS